MKTTLLILAASMLAALPLLSACATKTEDTASEEPKTQMITTTLPTNMEQTGWTNAVPDEYLKPAAHPGTVERLDYATKDYAGNGGDIQKTAYVYLPYGYDASDTQTRYDIVYLMHGWGGSAGEYFNLASNKDVFDNLIEHGDMKPAIFVSTTFYNEGSNRDFDGSVRELRAFHQDFENALMPAVEGKYHT